MEKLGQIYREFTGRDASEIKRLKGDASARCIYRIVGDDSTVIGVHGPDTLENRAFIGFTKTFRKLNLPVPEIYKVDSSEQYYLLEDLGDTSLFDHLNNQRTAQGGGFPEKELTPLYKSAVEYLSRFQIEGAEAIDYNLCYQTREFDRSAWEFDHNYFLNFFVDIMVPFYKERYLLEKELELHRDMLEPVPRSYFLYRDFQSRNIMITDNGLRFIDYQSGRLGAVSYDIASLLNDARADLPCGFRLKMLEYHNSLISAETGIETDTLLEQYNLYALMRILQALGSYGNNGIAKGNPKYLDAVPFALSNILNLIKSDIRFRKFPALLDFFNRVSEEKPWVKTK